MQAGRGANIVNQQFAWCFSLLGKYSEAQLAVWEKSALVQSLVWHLELAYVGFLQELAISQQLSVAEPIRVQALIDVIPAGRACPMELVELKNLEESVSWLSNLRAQPVTAAAILQKRSQSTGANIIAASNVWTAFDLDDVRLAMQAFKELVDRHRSLCQEC